MKKLQKGFTLIELLVVIAIIGILASIVLASLSTATSKGNDAKVEEQLSSVRDAAQIYYATSGSYGTTAANASSVCGATGMFADTSSGMKNLTTSSNYPAGTTVTCGASATSGTSATAFIVYANLSTAGSYFCVDNTGTAKSESSTPGSATSCP